MILILTDDCGRDNRVQQRNNQQSVNKVHSLFLEPRLQECLPVRRAVTFRMIETSKKYQGYKTQTWTVKYLFYGYIVCFDRYGMSREGQTCLTDELEEEELSSYNSS